MAPAEQESAAWAEAAKAAIAEKTTVLKSIVAELHEDGQGHPKPLFHRAAGVQDQQRGSDSHLLELKGKRGLLPPSELNTAAGKSDGGAGESCGLLVGVWLMSVFEAWKSARSKPSPEKPQSNTSPTPVQRHPFKPSQHLLQATDSATIPPTVSSRPDFRVASKNPSTYKRLADQPIGATTMDFP
ncbi:hypothetical protein E6O75_ATG10537 [Venturia nashicola]|uniref:Uncharacterized protein n=1 Tax=Venturia nashicola TaxID=86259 RepID=A0A4Z1NWN0_9PEZI|nr:hypothetical protein E6O75_ATG10537 [Venturia nashicola]